MNRHLLLRELGSDAVRVQVQVNDWREAVRVAGELLVSRGKVTPAYVDAMVAAIEQLGPYIVLTPGVALAHARPGPDVLAPGISLVTLASPVEFGGGPNDPVSIVFAFSAVDAESHLGVLQELATLLQRPDVLTGIREARSEQELLQWLSGNVGKEVL